MSSTAPSPMPPKPVQTPYPPQSQYGYQPSLAVGISGLVCFSLSTIAHTWQMFHYRMWWCVVLVIGGLTETIGYAARIYSWHDDTNNNAFLAQTVTLIIAPSFFSAALYIVFMMIIRIIGTQYSALRPVLYIWLFSAADVLSLVIQAIGGGMASQGSLSKNKDLMNLGTNIMVAGICWQMFTMAVFVILIILFVINTARAHVKLPAKLKEFCFGMGIVTLMIFIRCIYRTIELLGGWTGYIITHEVYFATLDEVPMIIAIVSFNVFHPGRYLPGLTPAQDDKDVALQDVEMPEAKIVVLQDSEMLEAQKGQATAEAVVAHVPAAHKADVIAAVATVV